MSGKRHDHTKTYQENESVGKSQAVASYSRRPEDAYVKHRLLLKGAGAWSAMVALTSEACISRGNTSTRNVNKGK
jgi:hypothetical protein